MRYFEEQYPKFQYPLSTDDSPGFRPAQLGAIHAAASHFVTRSDPGIVTMPTGSGKTAVAIASAFVLRAQRVLVVVPSRLVREQIAEEFETLSTLRSAGALSDDVPAPRVFNVKKRITSIDEWEALREFDVVVGTINSVSPEYDPVPDPARNLFDLVIVDEAHHSPARTWHSVLSHFSEAKQLLFTATPFRQDQREIKGRFIFTYDLKRAFEDGIFGQITYNPVLPRDNENHDTAIATAAERQLALDHERGFRHHLMVRTDSRKRANELATIYANSTNLRLRVVTGDKSTRFIQKVISDLESGDLDGILCVNMLGEGFNFPSLKIAAIHSPHRSLSVTLQFIGRFARTVGDDIGPATFLAVPAEIEIEAERLYDTRAVWQDMVQNLSAARLHEEAQTREVLASFAPAATTVPDLSDLSLYMLEPYFHVKIYQLNQIVDLREPIEFHEPTEVVHNATSDAQNAAIYITRETSLPRWTTDDRLAAIQYDLFVFFQDRESRLLFICASRRTEGLYEQLCGSFDTAGPQPLPLVRLNRALNDLTTPEFFNVGMRNRIASNTTESYRIITGSNADKAILKSDGRLFHRGHVFGRASDEGDLVTIGLSSASKVWSNRSAKLPSLIAWCEKLARRINTDRVPVTGSGLDYLDVGEEIEALPTGVIGVDWPQEVYRNPPWLRYSVANQTARALVLDFDLSVDLAATTDDVVNIKIQHTNGFQYEATFSFETDRYFEPAPGNSTQIEVEHDRGHIDLIDYLNEELLYFYTYDLSLVHGSSLLRPRDVDQATFSEDQFDTFDWGRANVDIQREFGQSRSGLVSVHGGMEADLSSPDCAIVYYDHGTGEVADFVAIEEVQGRLIIRLYHCKGATGNAPGHRLGDVYEIAGQAVKSVRWALKQRILTNIRRRFTQNIGGHRFIRGSLDQLENLLQGATPAQIDFEVIVVQPGLKKAGLPAELSNVLAAASDHLVRGGFRPLRVIGSM